MKTMPQLIKYLFLLLFVITIFSCSNDDSSTFEMNTEEETIVDDILSEETIEEEVTEEIIVEDNLTELSITIIETIEANDNLSLLKEAIVKAGLETEFSNEGAYTLFAPTNVAIEELFVLLGDDYNSFDDFNDILEIEILKRILLYHGLNKVLGSDSFTEQDEETLLSGDSIALIATGDTFVISDASDINANFITLDTYANNGVVHIIDKILIPAEVQEFLGTNSQSATPDVGDVTLPELVQENADFTLLQQALEITNLFDTLLEIEDFSTVLALNNDSFTAVFTLLEAAEITSLDDIDSAIEISLLREVLLNLLLENE